MRTNSRLFFQKGYGRLMFILLILAMCFTAFITVPFSNTQAKAYTYNAANIQVTNPHASVGGTNYAQVVRDTGHNKGGVYYGPNDAAGLEYIKTTGGGQDNIATNFEGAVQNLQFAPNYYDLSKTNAGTDLTDKLSLKTFKNGNMITTVKLSDMQNYFGVGSGSMGWQDKKNGANVSVTYENNRIQYNVDGRAKGGQNDDIAQSWRITQGNMYTFIQVPAELAPYLSVTASAIITTKSTVGKVPQTLGSHDYNDCKFLPVMDMQIGSKALTYDGSSVTPEFTRISNSQVTSDGGNDNTATTRRVTSEVKMSEKNNWIKLSFGVMTTNGKVYAGGLEIVQKWSNYLNVQDVQLQFKLTQPVLQTEPVIENADAYSNAPHKVVSYEVAALLGENNKISTEVVGFYIKVYDTVAKKDLELSTNQGSQVVDSANNKVVVSHTFNINTNGIYTIRIYKSGTTTVLDESKQFTIKNLDRGVPETPTINIKDAWVTNKWKTDTEEKFFKISNIIDTLSEIDKGANASPALASISLSLFKVKDNDDFSNYTSSQITKLLGNPSYTVKTAILPHLNNSGESRNIYLTKIDPDFYKNREYGKYALVFSVNDKAGNSSELQLVHFKYDYDGDYEIQNLQLLINENGADKWVSLDDFFNTNWLNNNTLPKNNNDISVNGKVNIQFSLLNDNFYFPLEINMLDSKPGSSGTIASFVKNKDNSVNWVTNGYYYVSIPLDNFLKKQNLSTTEIVASYFNSDVKIFGGNENDKKEIYSALVKIDTVNPFNNGQDLNLLVPTKDNGNEQINTNKWYTYRDNQFFINKFSNLVSNEKVSDGMYFLIETNEGVPTSANENYLLDYKFFITINGEDKPLTNVSVVNDRIGLFIPFADLATDPTDNKIFKDIVINVIDQAGNKTKYDAGYKTIETIKYDDTQYTFNSVSVSHLQIEEYGNFITFWSAEPDVVVNEGNLRQVAEQIPQELLSNLKGENSLRRGKQIFVLVDTSVEGYSQFELDGISLAEGYEIETSASQKLYRIAMGDKFMHGNNEGQIIVTYDLSVLLYENIDIDVYYGTKLLSTSELNTISYKGTDIQLTIKNRQSGYIITNGIVSKNFVSNKWTGIRNHTDGQEISVGVKDTVGMFKTKNDTVINIAIPKVKAIANINGKLDEVEGKKFIKQEYGKSLDLRITYENLIGEDIGKAPKMIFSVLSGAGVPQEVNTLDIGKYQLVFALDPNFPNDFGQNYNFVIKNDGVEVELVIEVVPRKVKVENITKEDGSTVQFNYGGDNKGVFATEGIKLTLNADNINGLEISKEIVLGNGISKNIKLVDKNNHLITRTSPAGEVYKFDVKDLSLDKYGKNVVFFTDETSTNVFEIIKREIELKINDTLKNMVYGTYDSKFDFIDKFNSDFINFVAEDSVSKDLLYNIIILDNISYFNAVLGSKTQLDSAALANMFKTQKYLNVLANNAKYTASFKQKVELTADEQKVLNNYNITLKPFEFEVTPKEINIGINVSESKLSYRYTGQQLTDGDFNIVADITSIKKDFLSSNDDVANSDYNLFTFNTKIFKVFPQKNGGQIKDIGDYKIAVPSLDNPDIPSLDGLIKVEPKSSETNVNYVFYAKTDLVFTIYKINDNQLMVEFTSPYYSFIYGELNTAENTNPNAITDEEFINNLKKDVRLIGSTGEARTPSENELSSIVFTFVLQGNNSTIYDVLSKANAGVYDVKVAFDKTYTGSDKLIDNTNAIVEIKQRDLLLEFNKSSFEQDSISLEYIKTFIYGNDPVNDKQNNDLLNEIFIIKDANSKNIISDGINRVVKGKFLLENANKSGKYYDHGKYSFDFSGVWFTATNQTTNFGNYNLILPSDAKNYVFDIEQRVIDTKYIKVMDNSTEAPIYEYGIDTSKINLKLVILSEGLASGDVCQFNKDGQVVEVLNFGDGNVGTYSFSGYGTLTNDNYKLATQGYFDVSNKLEIVKRQIIISELNYQTSKVFDNTNKLTIMPTSFIINGGSSSIIVKGHEIPINNLIDVEARYNSANVSDNKIIFNIMLKEKYIDSGQLQNLNIDNFEFVVTDDTTVNNFKLNAIPADFIITRGKAELVNATATITPLKLKLTAEQIASLNISKVYDGTNTFKLKDIIYNLTDENDNPIVLNTESAIKIFGITHVATFNQIEAGDNLDINYGININTNIINFTDNVKIYFNGEVEDNLINKDIVTNIENHSFNKTYIGVGKIDKYKIQLTTDSKVVKTYDKQNKINVKGDSIGENGSTYVVPGTYKFTDGSVVIINPVVFNNDILNITFDIGNIAFSDVNASENYVITIPVKLGDNSNINYELMGSTVNIFGIIKPKEISFTLTGGQSNITKEYDGTTNANVVLTEEDYVWDGIVTNKDPELSDEGKISPKVVGNAEYEDCWAGDNKPIYFRNVEIAGDEIIKNNYILKDDGKIKNLYGSITPRSVDIDKDQIIVYTTRYNGSKGANYKVEILNKVPTTDEIERFELGTVYVYMTMNTTNVGGKGILAKDLEYRLVPKVDMCLDNELTAPEQSVQLVKDSIPVINTNMLSPTDEARKAANSYKIGNIKDVFPDGNLPGKIIIQKYKITMDNIYFNDDDSFNKIYDGSIGLEERVTAKVGLVNKKDGKVIPSFLDEDINYINIKDRANVYDSPNVGLYNINIKLTDEIVFKNPTKAVWYEFSEDFTYSITKPSQIVPRKVHVNITAKGKIYDGTNAADSSLYTLTVNNVMTNKLEGLMKIHLGKIVPRPENTDEVVFATNNATINGETTSMKFGKINMYYVDTNLQCYNYDVIVDVPDATKIRVNPDGTVECLQLNITPKDLEVKAEDLVYEYGKTWGEITKDTQILLSGLIESDKNSALVNEYKNSIVIDYLMDGKPIIDISKVFNASNYKNAISIKTNKKLDNYNIIYVFGNIVVEPKVVKVTSNPTVINYGDGVTETDIKNSMVFKDKQANLITNVNELNIIKNLINIKYLPEKDSNAGEYELKYFIELIKADGYSNYNVTFEGNFTCTINTVDIKVDQVSALTEIKLMPNLDVVQMIKDKFEVRIDNIPFSEVVITLVDNDDKVITNEELTTFAEGNNTKVVSGLRIKYELLVTNAQNEKKPSVNYNVTYVNLPDFTIAQERINITVGDFSQTYTGEAIEYPSHKIVVSSRYIDYVKYVIFDSNNNLCNQVVNVGNYWVLVYSTSSAYKIASPSNAGEYINKIAKYVGEDFYDNAKANGFIVANMNVDKMQVRNNGSTSLVLDAPNTDANAVLNQIKASIILSDKVFNENNIEFNVTASEDLFSKPGTVNIAISLKGQDADGNNYANVYEIVNPNFTVRIRTKELAREDMNVVLKTKDDVFLNQNIVNSGIAYEIIPTDSNVDTIITNEVLNTIKEPKSIISVQFNDASLMLDNPVIIKIKVNPKYQDKGLYLINKQGLCKEIENVNYITENGNTYAEFTTSELGYFVQADAPSNPTSNGVIVAISIMGIALAILLAMLIYLAIQARKIKKFN